MDNMYLIQKMELANDIRPLASEVRGFVHDLNGLRNDVTHSFFPENRRRHMKRAKVLYKGVDVFTKQGLERGRDDFAKSSSELFYRAYRIRPPRSESRCSSVPPNQPDGGLHVRPLMGLGALTSRGPQPVHLNGQSRYGHMSSVRLPRRSNDTSARRLHVVDSTPNGLP